MSDPSNPFKSLADSLLSGDKTASDNADVRSAPEGGASLTERIEAFFSSELINARISELSAISANQNSQALEFIHAVAEEDPDPLLRIAATIQLVRHGIQDELETLKSLLDDEREDIRTYSLGLMLLDELPAEPLLAMTTHLMTEVPDEASNQAALIQLVREHQPKRLLELFSRCLNQVENDLEALDEDVWNELVYSQTLGFELGTKLNTSMQEYLSALEEDHPRKLDLKSLEDA